MAKVCMACGIAPPKPEQEPPPKPTKPLFADEDGEKCPNCGRVGTMKEEAEDEDEEEE